MVLHTENGMLGMGPAATGDEDDPDLTNAGKVPVRGPFAKDGGRKLVRACTVSAHGRRLRQPRLHAVFEIVSREGKGVRVLEKFGTSVEELRARLDVPLEDATS